MLRSTSCDKNVYIETFGCQMNDLDTDRMLGFLGECGYKRIENATGADLIIINTCTVRDKAEQKVYSTAGRYKALKEEKPGLIIAISGCVAQQRGEALLKRIPYLDLVIGTDNIHNIKALIDDASANKRVAAVTQGEGIGNDEFGSRSVPEGAKKALVSIMRGCDNYCSYCIVPYVRGHETSRSSADILNEVRGLAKKGVREVTLLGQNVNSYNVRSGGAESFAELLRLVAGVRDIQRIRFVTSHPKDLSSELIELFGTEKKLARHLHLPLQSGSDSVLKAMNRGYTAKDYLAKTLRLRSLYPDLSLTTDIIVGFPGETDKDFAETMELVEELRFDGIFSFKYSSREGTAAAELGDQIPLSTKDERLQILQKRHKEIAAEKNKSFVGQTVKVIVEGESKLDAHELTGRTSCNRVVNFPLPGEDFGDIMDILITDAYTNSLKGLYREGNSPCS